MWHLLFDFLLVALGACMGVVLMCLLVAGKDADKKMEEMKRRNEE